MENILYIEDNPDNRLLIRRVLEAEGYRVFEAASAAEALQIITTHPPHLIIMDINLPEVDGYSLTSQLKSKREFKSIPIIALTANVMRGDREKSLQAGCDGYIQKPIDVDTFPAQIRSYIKPTGYSNE
jgi:two-component system cell cycle response regulator DivK